MTYEAETLARQLGQLGRDLEHEVARLGELEELSADAEGEYRSLAEEYDDALARAFLDGTGSVDARKAQARLNCAVERLEMQAANLAWNKIRGRVRTQNANLQALHKRVEIGRSMLSREKALMSISGNLGET